MMTDNTKIGGDDAVRILQEVTLGTKPKTADTPDQARYREQIVKEVAAIKQAGGQVDVPTLI